MIPTLVITLREGLEASLIVGIVAAFLVKEGREDSLKYMWIGVGIAVVVCSAVAIGLRVADDQLPQRQQEGLETIVGLIAVAMITYMIVWMRRHSRDLKGDLEVSAAQALAMGSTAALVVMAFLAVLREGFETAVFLLAAFQDSVDTTAAAIGGFSSEALDTFSKDKLAAIAPAAIKGLPPSLMNLPPGCNFNPRCPYKQEICLQEVPPRKEVAPGHGSACFFWEEVYGARTDSAS